MRMLDLFCGHWGWSKAFAKRGWECVGVDLVEPAIPEIEGLTGTYEFLCLNVLSLTSQFIRDGQFDFICASPPCEEFSVWGMKHFHPNPKYPQGGIQLFNHTRAICEASGLSYVIENVRAAQQFVGNAVHHCGPFYLWGNAVPPIMPQGISKGTKFSPGRRHGGGGWKRDPTREEITVWRREHDPMWNSSKSSQRQKVTSQIATIPPELANCVCDFAERLLEKRDANKGGTIQQNVL